MVKVFFLCLGLLAAANPLAAQSPFREITYEITARNLSRKAIDTYPQKLIDYHVTDTLLRVVVSTFPAYSDTVRRRIVQRDRYVENKKYPRGVGRFLKPTSLTNYDHPEISRVADSILGLGDSLTAPLIMRSLKYVSGRIKFDQELALALDRGNCMTLPVAEILERGKGTCSEYTNLFIALMRKIGIPCRMAIGYIYIPEQNFQCSHAWAECYIDRYGWLAVDPQDGFMWYPPVAVKLFHGRDFLACNIRTLPDMYPIQVRILRQRDL